MAEEVISFEQSFLAALNSESFSEDEKFSDASERLYRMISYAKDRYHWYEEQREKKLTLALSMLTLSGVAITIIVNSSVGGVSKISGMQFFLVWSLLFSLIVTSMNTIRIYLLGQRVKYTHRENLPDTNNRINSIISWYAYGVPGVENLKLKKQDNQIDKKLLSISDGFEKFSKKVIERFFDRDLQICEDMQQVYILQIFQIIARENLQYMVNSLRRGALFVGVIALALVLSLLSFEILSNIQPGTDPEHGESSVNQSGIKNVEEIHNHYGNPQVETVTVRSDGAGNIPEK